jgi:hypothetical protein
MTILLRKYNLQAESMALDNTKEPIESIESLDEKIEQQADNIIRESEQIHDQEDMYTPECTYMPETPWSEK